MGCWGAFKTNEEAIEVLKEYTRDPENFIKPDGSNKKREKRKGCIFKSGNRWKVMYKHNYLGTFGSREHAESIVDDKFHRRLMGRCFNFLVQTNFTNSYNILIISIILNLMYSILI